MIIYREPKDLHRKQAIGEHLCEILQNMGPIDGEAKYFDIPCMY